MRANCPRSCCCRHQCDCGNICQDQPEYALQCPDWAKIGKFCDDQVYGEWMRATCPESCKICPWQENMPTTTTTTTPAATNTFTFTDNSID